MKYASFGCAIAKEYYSNRCALEQRSSECGADTNWNCTPNNWNTAKKVNIKINQMHRAAFTRCATRFFSIQLSEHRKNAATFCNIVRMRSMRTNDVVQAF